MSERDRRGEMRYRLQLLYPGIGLKRWVALLSAGVVLVALGVFILVAAVVSEDALTGVGLGALVGRGRLAAVVAGASLALGLAAMYRGLLGVVRFARTSVPGVQRLRSEARLARGPRLVAVGGGTGLSALLGGLKHHTSNLTAVVTVADDGGSSGRLRRDLGVLPPGDIRNCLVAMADDESLMGRLFRYRFPAGGLQGHSFGNLFLTALAEVTGDFEVAVQESSNVLKVRGRVLPATLEDVVLHADLEGEGHVAGQSSIITHDGLPLRVWLTPSQPAALPQAVEAIMSADMVVLGPGSLFTSIIPNILIPGIREALSATVAPVVYVCNVMTQPGETDGFTAADHLVALQRHGAAGLVDAILVSDTAVSERLAVAYQRTGAQPVEVDDRRLSQLGVEVVHADLAGGSDVFRHDPARLASAVISQALERSHRQ